MSSTFFKLVLRKFFNNISYSFILISGLVVGITTAILVFLWVSYEITYNRNHSDNERVFAVLVNENIEGSVETYEESPAELTENLSLDIPEIESFTRIDNTQSLLTAGSKSIQKIGLYADEGYFQVFGADIISGDRVSPLSENNAIAVSTRLAKLLFQDSDVVGKLITLNNGNDFKITSVFSEFPENSSLYNYDFVLPYKAKLREDDHWSNYYIKLNGIEAKAAVEQKINAKLNEFFGNKNSSALLFSLTDWRLHWNFENGKSVGGRIVYVVIFSVTAFFILLMAVINYVNIMTASAATRAREIGVRKMNGATRSGLVNQFLSESLLLTFFAALISLGVAYLLLPIFSSLTNVKLSLSFVDPLFIFGFVCITLITGLLAGSYPAFLLSSLKPALILKGNSLSVLTGSRLRKGLVIFQFTLSIVLIFSAIVMRQQTSYLLNKDLGYDKKNIINIWIPSDFKGSLQSFKAEIINHSSVVSAGFSGASPMEVNGSAEVQFAGKLNDDPIFLNGATSDHDLLPTLGFKIVDGRNFSIEFPSDTNSFIINQKAAEVLGFADPIGQTVTYTMFGQQQGKIIGVISDFHNEDIHAQIDPVIFTYSTERDLNNLFVRYVDGHVDEALNHVKTVFNKFQPGISLPYSFLDTDFENQFYQEKLLQRFSALFTIIAFVIAGLGLFGLTLFNTQRRTKEIGVRKVLGASVSEILVMLCKDLTLPIIVSFIIAFPFAYYLMEEFLAGYPFRITIPLLTFLGVAIGMIVFVLIVVSYNSYQAATKNPVESLKIE